jgi:predicted metal-binding membrane protein
VKLLFRLLYYRRAVVAGALILVVAVAWGYLLSGAGLDTEIGGGQMMATMSPKWNMPYAGLVLTMWIMMMIALMVPTAAPTVLLFTVLAGDRFSSSNLIPATAMVFSSGYVLVWCGFSVVATLLQWGLDKAGQLSESMELANATLASTVLIAAGVYQWTPLKDACLRHCRSPSEFLLRHWSGDTLGAARTRSRHGLFCVGCCWMLMALLFVGGLMNLAWVGAIALFVLVEKAMPRGIR